VLELEPGKWADPLACRIKHVALKDCGRYGEKYKALSYVWGTGHPDFALDVLGFYLMITQSLKTALMYLRSDPGSFVSNCLWVDQIYIYQDRYRSKCCRKLRFEPLICEGVGFAILACRVHRLLRAGSGSSTIKIIS